MTHPEHDQRWDRIPWPPDPYRSLAQAPPPESEPPAPEPSEQTSGATSRGAMGYRGRAAFDLGTTTATVTVHDSNRSAFPSLSPDQRRRLADELATVLDADPPGLAELREDWQEFRDDLAMALAALPGTAGAGTAAERLRQETGAGGVLDRVVTEIERIRVNRGSNMRRFLTPILARCYERALTLPPLDALRYYKVFLDGERAQELPSVVWDAGSQAQPRFGLIKPPKAKDGAPEPVAYRGLKQQLGRSTPRVGGAPGAPTFHELMTGALGDLVHRTDAFLEL